MHLISWNVAGRVKKLPAQVAALLEREPDVVALQEVTATTIPLWRATLEKRGYRVVASIDLEDRRMLVGGRRYGVLTASRWSLKALPPTEFDVPWSERVLSVVADCRYGEVEVHNAHLPAGVSHGLVKVETFEGIYDRLARESDRPRILCGDFNSPKEELADGTTVPFGEGNERWTAAELSVIRGLEKHDLRDAYRFVHGYVAWDESWVWRGRGRRYGRRFDHVFASERLTPAACRYLHSFREGGLSDHSPIETMFRW